MIKLGTNVCIQDVHRMFNAKYEEDSSLSSNVMANSIFENVKLPSILKVIFRKIDWELIMSLNLAQLFGSIPT